MKNNWFSICLAFFAAVLPWQIKYILHPGQVNAGQNNFLEIAIYGYFLILILFIVSAIYQTIVKKCWPKKISRLDWALLAFMVFIFTSTFFSPDYGLAFSHFLYFFGGAALLFFSRLFKREINSRLVVNAFLVSCILSAILGIFQFSIQRVPEIKYFVASHQVANFSGESVLENGGSRLLRAYGSFDHPNIFGGVMAIALLIVINRIFQVKNQKEWQVLIIAFILFFLALLMSFSRAAWLTFAVALAVRLVINRRQELFKTLMILGLSAAISLVFFSSYSGWLMARVSASGRLENISLEERWTGVKIVTEQILHNPFQSVGLGSYIIFLEKKVPNLSAWVYQPVHNAWLLLTVEAGFWVTITFLVIWLLVILENKKRQAFTASLVAALFVLSFFDHWLISLPFGILFCFFIFSLSGEETIV
ncbi:MAG: O-antigen ligase family protein [Patescibacteria group bacterium]